MAVVQLGGCFLGPAAGTLGDEKLNFWTQVLDLMFISAIFPSCHVIDLEVLPPPSMRLCGTAGEAEGICSRSHGGMLGPDK